MAATLEADFVGRLRRTLLLRETGTLSDAQLLSWYVAQRETAAFEAILKRHGGMVFGVCRRVLGNVHDAEDAFQATFMVLVRKAAAILPGDRLSAWLHGVAYRTALKARAGLARRRARERAMAVPLPTVCEEPNDLRPILDRELAALPQVYRQAVVLCDLEGKTRHEAAHQLGWPEGTLSGRLARGRRQLAARLTRRGVGLSVGALAACLSQQATAAGLPPSLCAVTLNAARLFAAGTTTGLSPGAAALTREVLQAMLFQKLKVVSFLVLVLVATVGVAGRALWAQDDDPPPVKKAAAVPVVPGKAKASGPLAGKLYLHLGHQLAIYQINQKKYVEFDDLKGAEWLNYQTQSARLSPSGRFLAFGVAEPGRPPSRLHIRDLRTDDPPEEIVSMPGMELSCWSWSPDGKKLTFAVWGDEGGKYRPYIVDVAKKKVAKLPLPPLEGKGKVGFGAVVQGWSPDGLMLVFARAQLHLVDPVSKEVRTVTPEPTTIWAGTCRFSPDGKKVLYIGQNKDKKQTLCVVDVALGKTKVLTTFTDKEVRAACWSPDSEQIAYSFQSLDDNGKLLREGGVDVIGVGGGRPRVLIEDTEKGITLTDWR